MIIQKAVRGNGNEFTYPGFERYRRADGTLNAYSTVLIQKFDTKYNLVLETLPIICGHGGSQWLCETCAKDILERSPK